MAVVALRSVLPKLLFLLISVSWSSAIEPMTVFSLGVGATEQLFNILDKFEVIDNPMGKNANSKKFLKEMHQLNAQIAKVESQLNSGEATMKLILSKLTQNTRLELKVDELSNLIRRLTISHKRMIEYTDSNILGYGDVKAENETLLDFAKWCVSHDTGSAVSMLERIHNLLVPDASPDGLLNTGLLQLITRDMKEYDRHVCTMRQSPNQLIFNMYNTIALTEIKGYIMMQFSYMLFRIYGKGNFAKEIQDLKKRYEQRTQLTVTAVKAALQTASREMWRCDPNEHINNQTYVSMTRLLEGYVANEADMSVDKQCWQSCDDYSYAQHRRCYDHGENCAVDPPCEGKILNCRFVDSDMWICPGSSRDRRYDYIEYENKKLLGQKNGRCPRLRKVDSWWRINLSHCTYCFCICDQESHRSDRYISMKELVANLSDNKVITGLRFIKKRGIIYLQMSTGTLLENGKIDLTSVAWNPIEDINLDRHVNGVDYHKLTYEDRKLDLDILQGPADHLLTGIKFRKLGNHLNMEIMITPFNFTTGKLISPSIKSHWHSNDNTDISSKPRTKLDIENTNVPTRSTAPSEVDSVNDQYIEFTHTGIDVDAAQTTVPFFDAQPVIPDYPVPLSGAGLYHKGQKGYGGFVGIKLITYDYSQNMEAAFPQTDDLIN